MSRFVAFYLPQYHPIKENNEWWGEGFTEWVNVAKTRPLFKGHNQPNIPSTLGFYDLRMEEIRMQQAEMAKAYGIEGFCYWHYWFGNGKRLLETPFEEVLKSNKPDFPFCLAWANHSWEKKTWDSKGTSEMLIEQLYPGKEDYIAHFNALLPAFIDDRYLKVEGKLIYFIFNPLGSLEVANFIKIWRQLAFEHNLGGFYFIGKDADSRNQEKILAQGCDAIYNDDVFNIHHHKNKLQKVFYHIKRNYLKKPTVFSYKAAIEYMVTPNCVNEDVIPVIAPNWDHSPRSAGKAIILHKAHPKYFKKVVNYALEIVKNKPKEKQLIVIKSWNEWGEGNYLEPDIKFGKGNLLALNESINEFNSKG